MSHMAQVAPRFPLRIIYDDGQLELVDTADDLLRRIDSLDTALERGRIWVRDDLGRTVSLRVVGGEIELFEAEP